MADNELVELHRRHLEAENDRRRRRNLRVDDLIQNIADPRVAERLRIYRLVEEKFLAVEKQVCIARFNLLMLLSYNTLYLQVNSSVSG